MCGRFALFTPPARLAHLFEAELERGLSSVDPSYNVAPTDSVLGVRLVDDDKGEHRELGGYRWGLILSGAKSSAGASRLINARAETIGNRPSFRSAYEHRRLVVPADGFYEWRKVPGKGRQPHFFRRADGEPISFAGLWEEWHGPLPQGHEDEDSGTVIRSCTIVTTTAGQDMDGIHDRMPVVLQPDMLERWLDPGFDRRALDALLRPVPRGTLVHHRVDPKVGNVRVNGPDLIAEFRPRSGAAEEPPGSTQLTLLGEPTMAPTSASTSAPATAGSTTPDAGQPEPADATIERQGRSS